MHLTILFCWYSHGKFAKNETCAKMLRFHILYNSTRVSLFSYTLTCVNAHMAMYLITLNLNMVKLIACVSKSNSHYLVSDLFVH